MLRITIEVCPPSGERKTIETIDVECVGIGGLDSRRRRYSVRRHGYRMRGIGDGIDHFEPDGALALVRKALATLEDR